MPKGRAQRACLLRGHKRIRTPRVSEPAEARLQRGQAEIRERNGKGYTRAFELYGKNYVLETGELAKQATGAVLVKQGDTTVLVTAVVSKERKNYDFFPLTVDFIEKMYAVGRIPGGYLKREARPSEKATLTARMIDRPIRPSFPDGFRNEVHIVATSLVRRPGQPRSTSSASWALARP